MVLVFSKKLSRLLCIVVNIVGIGIPINIANTFFNKIRNDFFLCFRQCIKSGKNDLVAFTLDADVIDTFGDYVDTSAPHRQVPRTIEIL